MLFELHLNSTKNIENKFFFNFVIKKMILRTV